MEIHQCAFGDGEAIVRLALSEGCLGRPDDREQDVCMHHLGKSTPLGTLTVIDSYTTASIVDVLKFIGREGLRCLPSLLI